MTDDRAGEREQAFIGDPLEPATTPAPRPSRRRLARRGSRSDPPSPVEDQLRPPGNGALRLGLRARATVGFGLTGFLVAVALAVVTYTTAKTYLVDQRQRAAEQQTYVNARLARAVLRDPDPDVPALLGSLGRGTASSSLLRYRGEWFSATVTPGTEAVPSDLVRVVTAGRAGQQRYRDADGELRLAVGVPIATAGGAYYELFALDELTETLALLARSLAFGVVAAALAAAAVGRAVAGRLLRPLEPIADAAERITGGALDTRLTGIDDPDLDRLTASFNEMADALEARIDRETRFAADVSHELRSPLTAVRAAVEIIDRRRDQLPCETVEAFAVLTDKVEVFQRMVLDLLEISKVDAGRADLSEDLIDLDHFLSRVLVHHGAEVADLSFEPGAPTHLFGDRRRLSQAIGNVIDNAARYAGGVTSVVVAPTGDRGVRIALDDRGPGVPPEEREAIFGRFARGRSGLAGGGRSGSGLGLSLVAEHIRLHGGRAWVEDSPAGGARFVLELPGGER